MTNDQLFEVVKQIIRDAPPGSNLEGAERAGIFTCRRIMEGSVTTENEAKLCFVAFADGFCTGKGCDGSRHYGHD